MTTNELKDYTIALKEVPKHLGLELSESTLRRWVREGRLVVVKKAGRIYASTASIEAICASNGEAAA